MRKLENHSIFAFLVTLILLMVHVNVHAAASTEADTCVTCDVPRSQFPELEQQSRAITAPLQRDQCDIQTLLVDPHQKSVLEGIGLPYNGRDPLAVIGRSALTCMYGALKGVAGSVRDLVMLVPSLLGATYEGLKSASQFDYAKWFGSIHPTEIADRAGQKIAYGADAIRRAFQSAKREVYHAYQTGGTAGAIAAVAHASAKASPHRVIGNFLAKIGRAVAEAASNEWAGFTCLSPETMVQNICNIIGYVGTDIVTGKVALSALRRTPKFLEALKKARAVLETKPGIGKFLMKGLERTSESKCAAIGTWMEDAQIVVQQKHAKVAIGSGRSVYALAIDPKTKKETCFQVVGQLAVDVAKRIKSTESRAGAAGAVVRDVYSPQSVAHARTMKDYVADVNLQAGRGISRMKLAKVTKALEASPELAEPYGRMMSSLDELRRVAGTDRELLRRVAASEGLIESATDLMLKAGSKSKPQIEAAAAALAEAQQTGDTAAVNIISRALSEVGRSASKGKSAEELADSWTQMLRRSDRHLTEDELRRARQCLFGSVR